MKDVKESRIKIVSAILVVLILILFVAAFRLMVVHGEEYRLASDTKRIKDVYTKAPRGDILDRNGKVLATTRNSFTVKLYADDLKRQDADTVNRDFKLLIDLLEEDGVTYGNENPIDMYVYSYKDIDDYLKEDDLPEDLIIQTIIEEDLIKDFLQLYSTENVNFSNTSRAINVLENRSQEEIPIQVDMDGGIKLEYKEVELDSQEENLPEDPIDYLVEEIEKIENNEAVIGNILDHPISRKLTYELLDGRNLIEEIELLEYVYVDEVDYLQNKAELSKNYENINLESEAIDDFVVISSDNLDVLLTSLEINDEEEKEIIPAEILIGLIEEKTGEDTQISVAVDGGGVDIYYDEDVATTETPLARLIRLAEEADVLYEFIIDEEIKFLAQDANTRAGVTPNISVLEWEYIFVKNKRDMLERYGIAEDATAKEALDKIGEDYQIQADNDYEKLRLVALHKVLDSQGYRAFEPIILTYGLKEETVAKIEEQIFNTGIEVAQHPVRYYPQGTTAAHVLGYVGKISQPNEITSYVEERGYAPGDIIGKTGVEESYETTLRGRDGKQVVQVDSMGNTTNVLEETPPIKGNSLYLTLDLDLQKVAEGSLRQTLDQLQVGGNFQSKWGEANLRINEGAGRPHYNAKSGSVVVLDVNTGEVLALANESTYDPNLFATGISDADWKSLFPDDENNPLADRPLLNIAMQTAVSPGSTFKLVPQLAALEQGLSPYTEINCTGYIDIGDTRFGCWIYNQYGGAHGYEDAFAALRDSCNYYYYVLALGENPNTGEAINVNLDIDDIREFAMKVGLSEATGIEINIPYESAGSMPNPDEKRWIVKNQLALVLEEDLEKYIKEDVSLNPDSKEEIISQVVSLIDYPDMEYQALVDRLEEIGIDTTKNVEGDDENMVDRIKYTYINQGNWNVTDILNVVIGQGQNAYTPLQMANYMSTISNGGYKNKVSVIQEVKSSDGSTSLLKNEAIREKIDLNNEENLGYIKEGLNMASHTGSIENVFGNFPVEVGLKTGTAERDGINPETGEAFDDYSWMIAFAPYEDPQIAICTLLYESGSGSNGSAIVREIVGEYMGVEPESSEEKDTETEEETIEEEYYYEEVYPGEYTEDIETEYYETEE